MTRSRVTSFSSASPMLTFLRIISAMKKIFRRGPPAKEWDLPKCPHGLISTLNMRATGMVYPLATEILSASMPSDSSALAHVPAMARLRRSVQSDPARSLSGPSSWT